MKILAFVDLHSSKKNLLEIIKKSKDVDLLICAGDLLDWGSNFKSIIKSLEKTKKPLLIIHGNHESKELINKASVNNPFLIPIHKKIYILDKYAFVGYGGEGFSEYYPDLERLIPKFKKEIQKNKKIIFISHAPPYNTKVDFLPHLGHRGSKTLRTFIKELKPILHICGHFHETAENKDYLGKTLIINPGPKGKIINLD